MARYALPGDNVFPEGITEGGGTVFYVGSMGDGTIYRGDTATSDVQAFVPANGDGRVTVTGLDLDGYGRLIACDYDGGQLFAYDLATRELAARRALPAQEAWPNDVVVAGDNAYVTDTRHPRVWRLPVGRGGIGDAELAIDLAPFGPADPAYLNGIVAHPDGTSLLVASQGEGGALWRVDLASHHAAPVDLGGYEFNADGMLLDGDLLYGVTNRGENIENIQFMISVARLAVGGDRGRADRPKLGLPHHPGRHGRQTTHRLLPGPRDAHPGPAAPALRDRHHRSAAPLLTLAARRA